MGMSIKNKIFSAASAVIFVSQIGFSQVSVAAGSDVTIVASGGAAQGTSWDVSGGVLTSTSAASVNASDISGLLNSGNLIIDASSLLIQDSITSTSGHNLTFKSTGNIRVIGGVGISTGGGNVTFQSDSDESGAGSTRLGGGTGSSSNSPADSTVGFVNSGGGNIIFSGGLNVDTGFARASSDYGYINGSKPRAGVAIYGFNIDAAGGNIVIRSSGGTINTSTRGLMIEQNVTTRARITTSGSGSIQIIGDGSTIAATTAWGAVMSGVYITSGSGNISVNGKGNTAYGNARGIASSNVSYQSSSGTITLNDETDGTAANYSGSYFGAPNVFSTNSTVNIKSDKLYFENTATSTFTCSSASIEAFNSSSFTAAQTMKQLDATNCPGLTIGATGNSSDLTLAYPVDANGSIRLNGAAISLAANVTAVSNLIINASGNVTQSGSIRSAGLKLAGAGAFTLNKETNEVTTIAAGNSGSRTGAINFYNSLALNVGTVDGSSGVYSTSTITLSTATGNLNITQPVSTNAATGDKILIFANKNQTSGSAGTGNITVSGSGALQVESGARALLFSGSRPDSGGLVNAVGGEANTRSLIDSATVLSSISPSISSTGMFALFRTSTPSPAAALSDSELTAAALAKREEERKLARGELSSKFKNAEQVSIDLFSRAGIAGVTEENIGAVQSDIFALPESSRGDIAQILKIAFKYEVVGKIASSQNSQIFPSDLITVGLLPENGKNKTLLTLAVKKLPSAAKASFESIKLAVDAEIEKLKVRSSRIAALAERKP